MPLTAGATTRASYGCLPTQPVILKVTNLSDSGAGSLRAALTDARPRVVVFETSGWITLLSEMSINTPCLTVAGQTAPSPGIAIRGNASTTPTGLYVNTRDVLLQHIRMRMGQGCNSAIQMYGGAQQRIVLDHLSIAWSQDDSVAASWTNGQPSEITLYRSIIAEGLYRAPNTSGCSGGGTSNGHGWLGAASSGMQSIVQSLFATNYERNPYVQGDTRLLLLNALVFQWHGPWGFFANNYNVSSDGAAGPWRASVVGNRFIAGPNSCCRGGGDDPTAIMFTFSTNMSGNVSGNQIYRSDNTLAPVPTGISVTEESNQYSYSPSVSSPPVPLPVGYVPLASSTLEETLLPIIGARPADRDGVDVRILANVKNRTGTFVSDISEVGGFPPLQVHTRPFEAVSDPNGATGSGYTRLERQLHQAAADVEGAVLPPVPPLGPEDVPPAAGTTFVSDTFTDPAGTALTAHLGETGAAWEPQQSSIDGLILSGAHTLYNIGLGDGTLTLASGSPVSSEYDVHADLVLHTLIPGHQYGIWARATTSDPLTGLAFLYDVSSATWTLSQFTERGFSTLGSCVRTLPSGTTRVTLRVRLTSVHGIIAGSQCASSADAELDGLGRIGVSTYFPSVADSDSTGVHFDTVAAIDVTTGSLIPPPLVLLAIIGFLTVIVVILVFFLINTWAGPRPDHTLPGDL
jgi:hypothetical protein